MKFKANELFTYQKCMKKCAAYRFRIFYNRRIPFDGSYDIFWGGNKPKGPIKRPGQEITSFGTKCAPKPTPAPKISCSRWRKPLHVEFKGDQSSTFMILLKRGRRWRRYGRTLQSKPGSTYKTCLPTRGCYMVKILKGDGKVIFDDQEIKDKRKGFGRC